MSEKLKRHESALGASGTDVVGKIHNADDHIELLRGDQASQVYDKMRRSDTQVRKVLSSINNPIKSANWMIQPASDDKVDLERAALIDQILFSDINWAKFLNEALTAVPHGFSLFEVVHKNQEDREHGAYTGLAQLGYRKQTTITEWCHDRVTGELEQVKQEAFGDIAVSTFLPAEFLLGFYMEQEGDNIGFPLLRSLFGPYKRKLLALELQYIGIERFAIPTPILKTPKTMNIADTEYIDAVEILKGFTSAENSYITYPDGWDLQLHNNVFDPEKLSKVIQAENEAMTGAILASFLELGTGGNGGAYALSRDQSDFFLEGIEYYANVIRDTINLSLIPQLIELNFGEDTGDNPTLQYSGISDKAGKELMEVITGYVGSNVIAADEPLEDFVRVINNLPPKAGGDQLTNQESSDDGSSERDVSNDDIDDNDNDDNDSSQVTLAESTGHVHKGTGPAIVRGQKHFHEMLDSNGNAIGRTSTEKAGADHFHITDENTSTGKPIATTLEDEEKDNPKNLIDDEKIVIASIIRSHLKSISDKYINDVLNNYKNLSDNDKLKAVRGVKVGGIAKFRKDLKAEFTNAGTRSLSQARRDVPSAADVKLSDNMDAIKAEFKNWDTFKFSDFSKLPKRIQILIANMADLISDKEAKGIASTVAFQFTSSESSTNDIQVLRDDMLKKADEVIQSGTKDTVASDQAATVVNESRNEFMLNEEVKQEIASFTFVNFDPKAEICKTLAGSVYNVDDQELVRLQPPLHQNCKSYIRANLRTNKKNPDITGVPSISKTAQNSITFKEGK